MKCDHFYYWMCMENGVTTATTPENTSSNRVRNNGQQTRPKNDMWMEIYSIEGPLQTLQKST